MQTRNRAIMFSGLVVDLEQMEVLIGDKGWYTYQVVRHPGGVAVLPLHDDGTVTLDTAAQAGGGCNHARSCLQGGCVPERSLPPAAVGNWPRRRAW